MRKLSILLATLVIIINPACKQKSSQDQKSDPGVFPDELVEFKAYEHNPLFTGTNSDTWDKFIRERGFILVEDSLYKLWYTGYSESNAESNGTKYLGYATSRDGINWTRFPKNPVFKEKWTEDMFVTRQDGKYYMFAEGVDDVAHLLTSENGTDWEEQGDLTIRTVKGDSIYGPYGTPSVFIEDGKWYLFYERNDEGIWVATSEDKLHWTNIQDEPVLAKGPDKYDEGAVAANQVIKYKGNYYIYYHGSSSPDWNKPGNSAVWTSNVAYSPDLIHWIKYPENPIVDGDHSSPIMVPDGNKFRLYTMHDEVWLYFSK
jgi:hypothetical protein